MKDKIANSIALHQQTINELNLVKERLSDAVPGSIKFEIKSKQLFFTDLYTHRDSVPVSDYTMKLVIDKAIEKEKDYINKLIDMEIERRLKKNDDIRKQ